MDQVSIKYTIALPSKIDRNLDFWFETNHLATLPSPRGRDAANPREFRRRRGNGPRRRFVWQRKREISQFLDRSGETNGLTG
jgi:hypothetical protein